MRTNKLFNRVLLVLSLITFNLYLPGQVNNVDTGFVPEVGQQGKDVVWVPTPTELVNLMLKTAKVTAEDFVVDLGSGDGRTVIAAAKIGAHAIGIEYNPEMVALSKRNAEHDGVSARAEFIETDLYEYDLSKATVITMFLLPEINLKLRPRLLALKPGTRIVSNTFTMGDWEADYEVTTEENWNSWNTALMWIVPAKAEGNWQLGKNGLSITQEFQMIHGNLSSGNKEIPITDGRLNGTQITFRVNGDLYLGQVNGTKMSGTVTNGASKSDWAATKLE